jgi:carboxymethylenebutenolidase
MGEVVELESSADAFAFNAYHASPMEARRGGVIVLHAIWGVTPHIRSLCDDFAEHGYETVAPSLFDRFERGFPATEVDESARERRLSYAEHIRWGEDVLDAVDAAAAALALPVSVVGFGLGGTAAWLAACRLEQLASASCFYGPHTVWFREERPRCATMLHFGKMDRLIPLEEVEAIAEAQPELPIYLYDAGHAFMEAGGLAADAARLAWLRILRLLHTAGGGRGESGGA